MAPYFVGLFAASGPAQGGSSGGAKRVDPAMSATDAAAAVAAALSIVALADAAAPAHLLLPLTTAVAVASATACAEIKFTARS